MTTKHKRHVETYDCVMSDGRREIFDQAKGSLVPGLSEALQEYRVRNGHLVLDKDVQREMTLWGATLTVVVSKPDLVRAIHDDLFVITHESSQFVLRGVKNSDDITKLSADCVKAVANAEERKVLWNIAMYRMATFIEQHRTSQERNRLYKAVCMPKVHLKRLLRFVKVFETKQILLCPLLCQMLPLREGMDALEIVRDLAPCLLSRHMLEILQWPFEKSHAHPTIQKMLCNGKTPLVSPQCSVPGCTKTIQFMQNWCNTHFEERTCFFFGESSFHEAEIGLFTKKVVKKQTLLMDFVGKLVPRSTSMYDQSNVIAVYVVQARDGSLVDASSPAESSAARMINHSRERANVKFAPLAEKRIGIVALRDICVGEEILADYGDVYFD